MSAHTEPTVLQAGDTLSWTVDLPTYRADDGWVLSYRLINAAGRIDIVAAPDPATPSLHRVGITAATSATYAAGEYTAVRYVSRGTERFTLDKREMRVAPDLAAATDGQDARTEARRALADLRAALRRWLTTSGQVQSYQIAGRSMTFVSADEIRKRIQLAESEVAREDAADRIARGLPSRRKVYVRF